jgi:hypothetical protein
MCFLILISAVKISGVCMYSTYFLVTCNVLFPNTESYRLSEYLPVIRNKTLVPRCQYSNLTLHKIPKYFRLIPIVKTYGHKINLNLFFPTAYQSLNQTLFKTFPHQNFVHTPCLPARSYMISPSYLPQSQCVDSI